MLVPATKAEWKDRVKQMKKNYWHSFTKNGRKKVIKKYYDLNFTKELDFNNCETFNEKLQLRKLNVNPKFVLCADKVRVREYVKEKIGKKYLIEEYFHKKKITMKDIEKLPNRFAIKTNNASGTNVIVYNKKDIDKKELVNVMNFFTKIKFGYFWGEYFYNKIKPQIIVEKLLIDKNGKIPDDFKIHCFNNGKEKHKFYETFYLIDGNLKKNIYDENWKILNYEYGFDGDNRRIAKPKKLNEINEICDRLSEGFNYVRIDLYLFQNRIYFGEMTFTPGAGFAHFRPEEKDLLWGKYMGEEIK